MQTTYHDKWMISKGATKILHTECHSKLSDVGMSDFLPRQWVSAS